MKYVMLALIALGVSCYTLQQETKLQQPKYFLYSV